MYFEKIIWHVNCKQIANLQASNDNPINLRKRKKSEALAKFM